MANNSTLAFSTPMTNRLGPVQNHPPSDSNFTPYQIAQKLFIARTQLELHLQLQANMQEQQQHLQLHTQSSSSATRRND